MSEDRPNTGPSSSNEQSQSASGSGTPSTRKPSSRSRTRQQPSPAAMSTAGTGTGEAGTNEPSVERAEKIVEEWTKRAEQMGSQIGQQFVRMIARAREEAEDILAEAQSMRRHEGTEQRESEP